MSITHAMNPTKNSFGITAGYEINDQSPAIIF